jgi:hypothetical protein
LIAATVLAAGVMATGAHAADESSATTQFVEMDTISVPIVDSNRVDGALHVKLMIDVADPVTAERLRKNMPALREAALGAALDFARVQASAYSPVDVASLDTALTSAVGSVDKAASHVLIVEVSARRS